MWFAKAGMPIKNRAAKLKNILRNILFPFWLLATASYEAHRDAPLEGQPASLDE